MATLWKRAIIVGASSGLGAELARQLTASGCSVVLFGRRADKLKSLCQEINGQSQNLAFSIAADVLDHESITSHFQSAIDLLKGLDLFIYSAGIMPIITETEYDSEKDSKTIRTNLESAILWTNCAAKRFERAKSGTIIGIGSVSGDRGRRGFPAYSASKAGLECYLESLRNRLSKNNVSVVTIKPGPIHTEMTEPLGKRPGMINVNSAATLILKGASKFSKTVYVPAKWYFVALIIRALPSLIMRKLKF